MTIPVWPVVIRKFMQSGYGETVDDGRLSTKTSIGPGKVRRLTSSASRPAAGSILLHATGWARIKKFWAEDTVSGVLPFWFPDPIFDGLPLQTSDGDPVLTTDGVPLLGAAKWLARFDKAPAITQVQGTLFTIGISLNVLALP